MPYLIKRTIFKGYAVEKVSGLLKKYRLKLLIRHDFFQILGTKHGPCTAQMYGTFRIAIQYCDGSNWLTMQSPQKLNEKPNCISGKPFFIIHRLVTDLYMNTTLKTMCKMWQH